jgi:hypothetical protein
VGSVRDIGENASSGAEATREWYPKFKLKQSFIRPKEISAILELSLNIGASR